MRAGAIGDVLLLRPSVWALRQAGFAPVLLAPGAPGAVLVGGGGSEVGALLDWERPHLAALLDAGLALPGSLARDLEGVALALACSRNDVLAARLGEMIPRVASVDPAPAAGVHAAEWYRSALGPLGIEGPADSPPPLEFSLGERTDAERVLARLPPRFLALHPGSGSPAKNWPAERYAAVAGAIAGGRPWLLVEGPADGAAADALTGVAGAVRLKAPPLRTLGAVLARAGLVAGNDSGIVHLAAAAGAPTLALFGPTDPAQWAPVGRRVSVMRAPGGEMKELDVASVVRRAREFVPV